MLFPQTRPVACYLQTTHKRMLLKKNIKSIGVILESGLLALTVPSREKRISPEKRFVFPALGQLDHPAPRYNQVTKLRVE